MRKWLVLSTALVALALLSGAAMAASIGAPLPPGASEVEVFMWDDSSSTWVSQGTGEADAYARSWNSFPVNSGGMTNVQKTGFVFTQNASVAQWIDWSITGTRKDWRVRRPGVYAADSIGFSISSNNDVRVKFEDFGDLTYEDPDSAPAGTQTTIETWYGYGATIDEAEENGWVRAAALNEEGLLIPNSNPLHYGLSYKLWSKIQVERSNNSSDYFDSGIVTFCLTNMKHWIDPRTGLFAEDQYAYPDLD